MSTAERTRIVVARVACALLLAVLAFVTRASMRAQVFEGGEVTPVEVDAFFHLRRVTQAAASFPTLSPRDPMVGWPRGAVIPWPEGFDWTLAAVARLLGQRDPAAVAVVAAWAPLVAGVAVVLATWALCLRLLRGSRGATGAALLAGLVAALAPQSVATSLVGRIDHHVVEQATVLALLAWTLARPGPDAPAARAWRFELAGAVVLGLSLWCFNGSVLYAAVAAAVLAARALADPPRARRAGLGALAFFAAAPFVAWRSAAAVRAHGRAFDYLFTSYLQPALLVLSGAIVLLAAEVARADRRGEDAPPARRVARRAAATALASLLGVGLVMLAVPALRVTVLAGLRRWLAREDPYMASIAEVQPLFAGSLRAGAATLYRTLGAAGFAQPVAIALALVGLARERRRGVLDLGAWWLALALLTLAQMRFGRVFAPIAALTLGVGAWSLARALRGHSWSVAVPWALAALWLGDPRARVWLRARPPGVVATASAARFLRAASRADEGVFTTWDDGNIVLQKAGRPVLVTSFGSYVASESFWASERAWLGDEAALDAFLDARRVRWIVAGPEHFGGTAVDPALPPTVARAASGEPGFNATFFRRVPLAALALGGGGAPRLGVASLTNWMPRMSVGRALRTREGVAPALWVYERVAGAVLHGHAPDGALVTLTTPLRADGAPVRHVAWTRAAGGSWTLRTALPTGWRSANLATADAATLAVGDDAPGSVTVSEESVRAGGAAADLTRAAAPPSP